MDKNLRILAILTSFLVFSVVVASEEPYNISWTKTLGGSSADIFQSVQQTSDGGYILAGYTDSAGAGSSDGWLVKTEDDGTVIWDHTFGGPLTDSFNSVQQTSDGGYILAGYTDSAGAGSSDGWLVKVDSSGNLVWEKTFGGLYSDNIMDVAEASDGGYVFAVNRYYLTIYWPTLPWSYPVWDENVVLTKTDENGEIEWETSYGQQSVILHDYLERIYTVQKTSDGGYIFAGTKEYSMSLSNMLVLKTDGAGNVEWGGIYQWGDDYEPGGIVRDIQQTSDGGYIATGQSGLSSPWFSAFLMKLDSGGQVSWYKNYLISFGLYIFSAGDRAYSVVEAEDGGYLMVGGAIVRPFFEDQQYDSWLVETDVNGNTRRINLFTQPANDFLFSLQRTRDNGLILAGITNSEGTGGYDGWVIKLMGNSTEDGGGFPDLAVYGGEVVFTKIGGEL